MKPKRLPRGLRILIVEDEEDTVNALRWELQQALSEAQVDSAGTVAEAERKLDRSIEAGQPYDVAILDYKLPPEHPGQSPEKDHSLGMVFRDRSPGALVVHVTAYQEDPGFRSYIRYRDAPPESGRVFVAKEMGWMGLLVEAITRHIWDHRVRERFDALFRRQPGEQPRAAGQRHWAVGRSDRERSLAVAELCADASQHWECLSKALQDDLSRALGHHRDKKGRHYVGVVEAESEQEHGANEEDI